MVPARCMVVRASLVMQRKIVAVCWSVTARMTVVGMVNAVLLMLLASVTLVTKATIAS